MPPILFSVFHKSTLSLIIIFLGFGLVMLLYFLSTNPSKNFRFSKILFHAFFTKLQLKDNLNKDFTSKGHPNTVLINDGNQSSVSETTKGDNQKFGITKSTHNDDNLNKDFTSKGKPNAVLTNNGNQTNVFKATKADNHSFPNDDGTGMCC